MSIRASRNTRAMSPSRLTQFLDNPMGAAPMSSNSRGGGPGSHAGIPMYDPSVSWDGLSVDPRPFSRLDAKPQTQTGGLMSRPSGLAGSRVIELEETPAGGALCFSGAATTSITLPHTEQQTDALFAHNMPPKSIISSQEYREDALLIDDPYFRNMSLEVPPMRAVTTPADVQRAMMMEKQGGLLTPADRRAALVFAVKQQKANKLQKTAELQQRRRVQLMRARHPDGALGVDSTANLDSAVYRDRAGEMQTRADLRGKHLQGRRSMQQEIGVAEERLGYNPFHHCEQLLPPNQNKFLQSKSGPRVKLDTHDRVFGERQLYESEERKLALRTEDLAGKSYNIINMSSHQPSLQCAGPERLNKKLAHMSQQSCERGRSEQGLMRPSDRMTSPYLDPAF